MCMNLSHEHGAQLIGISADKTRIRLQDARGKSQDYTLTQIPTDWPGVAFCFVKPAGERYDCFVAAQSEDRLCDCIGFMQHGHCKHVAYLAYAWGAGLLPLPGVLCDVSPDSEILRLDACEYCGKPMGLECGTVHDACLDGRIAETQQRQREWAIERRKRMAEIEAEVAAINADVPF